MRRKVLVAAGEVAGAEIGQVRYRLCQEVSEAAKFFLGLMHDESHPGQIAEIVRRAREARRELL